MSFFDGLIRIFAAIEPVVPQMIICLATTAAALFVLLILGDSVWINQKKFKLFGVFYGLNGYDCLRLAVSWLRLVLTVSMIVMGRDLLAIHYVIYAMEGLIFICDIRHPARILINLIWVVLQFLGVVAANLLNGYLRSMMYLNIRIWVIYIFISIFLVLFSIFIFLNEVDQISQDRVLLFDNEDKEARNRESTDEEDNERE